MNRTLHSNLSPGHASFSRTCTVCSKTVNQTGGKYIGGKTMGLWCCAKCVAEREARIKAKQDAKSTMG